jgi:tRNA splicing endonuclease
MEESSSREKEREKFIAIARRHFERKGYRVHSGLQFGVELVLYAGELCVLKITC